MLAVISNFKIYSYETLNKRIHRPNFVFRVVRKMGHYIIFFIKRFFDHHESRFFFQTVP